MPRPLTMLVPRRLAWLLAAGLAWASAGATAHAYSAPEAFPDSPVAGGGGGRWFTGSPADGFGCSVCHVATPGQRVFPFYVAGLPLEGYELATRNEVVLSWPEFAQRWKELRPDPAAAPTPDQPGPGVGLVAELVAESGKASGTIEIDTASAQPGELCEQTRPNLQPRLGVKLYQVRPGLDPVLLKPDSTGLLRCDSRLLGQRCILALSSCGAQQIRFTWTSPPTAEGPIWFSAGFVATESLSRTPDHDSEQEIALPLVQAGTPSATYRETLQNACALVRARSRPGSRVLALGLGLFVVVLVGRRSQSRARRRARGHA